jgi:hypothetical protein
MCPKRQLGDDAEAGLAGTAESPKQIRIRFFICGADIAVHGHDVHRQEVVAGEPELSDEEAEAAGQCMARNAESRAGSGGDRLGSTRDRSVDVAELSATADRYRVALRIEVNGVQATDVDDHVIVSGCAFVTMASGSHGKGHGVLAAPSNRFADGPWRSAIDDDFGTPALEAFVVISRQSIVWNSALPAKNFSVLRREEGCAG